MSKRCELTGKSHLKGHNVSHAKNKTKRKPDYYLHETDKWLVFPHELEGLSMQEIKDNKPEVSKLIDQISPLIK